MVRKNENPQKAAMREMMREYSWMPSRVCPIVVRYYHVRNEGRIVTQTVYIALGIDMNGRKNGRDAGRTGDNSIPS